MNGANLCTLVQYSILKPFIYFQVITEKAAKTTIHLLMQDASETDSGVFECIPDNAPPAKVKVHILTAGNYRVSHINWVLITGCPIGPLTINWGFQKYRITPGISSAYFIFFLKISAYFREFRVFYYCHFPQISAYLGGRLIPRSTLFPG